MQVLIKTEPLTRLFQQADKLGHANDAALVGGRAVRVLLVSHFMQLDATRANKLGGERSHFYARAAKATSVPQSLGAGTVEINISLTGLSQRWLGGDIFPGRGTSSTSGGPTKYLAIPARAEAYGKAPGEFNDLEFIPFKSGKRGRGGMLVEVLQTRIITGKKLKSGQSDFSTSLHGGLVMFWLVDHVHQNPDPTIMPDQRDMNQEAETAIDGYLTRLLQNN